MEGDFTENLKTRLKTSIKAKPKNSDNHKNTEYF